MRCLCLGCHIPTYDKILANDTHLLIDTNSRTSSRARPTFGPQLCHTEMRINSFSPFFMTYNENGFIYTKNSF